MDRRSLRALVALLVLVPALAGCTNEDHTKAPPEVIEAVADTRPTSWAPGDYWAYAATFQSNKTYHIALIVHETTDGGFRLGSNLSSGFFGLPFSGNVTQELNPEIGGSVWPMFRFPLSDGMTWEYSMFGHDAKTTAHATVVRLPDGTSEPGFRFESSSFGQVFARYDYAPSVGWFTRLELIEPTDRTQVLDVRLEDHGARFGGGYYVERVIDRVRIEYPATVPGEAVVRVPAGYLRVHVTLTAQSSAGVADARVEDARGHVLAEARVAAKGLVSDRATAHAGGQWTLHHAGSGLASVYVEVTGVQAAGAGRPPPAGAVEPVDMADLLASAARA